MPDEPQHCWYRKPHDSQQALGRPSLSKAAWVPLHPASPHTGSAGESWRVSRQLPKRLLHPLIHSCYCTRETLDCYQGHTEGRSKPSCQGWRDPGMGWKGAVRGPCLVGRAKWKVRSRGGACDGEKPRHLSEALEGSGGYPLLHLGSPPHDVVILRPLVWNQEFLPHRDDSENRAVADFPMWPRGLRIRL